MCVYVHVYGDLRLSVHILHPVQAYLSILYLKPRAQIILRQKKVLTKLVSKSLSSIENDVYKPTFNVSFKN